MEIENSQKEIDQLSATKAIFDENLKKHIVYIAVRASVSLILSLPVWLYFFEQDIGIKQLLVERYDLTEAKLILIYSVILIVDLIVTLALMNYGRGKISLKMKKRELSEATDEGRQYVNYRKRKFGEVRIFYIIGLINKMKEKVDVGFKEYKKIGTDFKNTCERLDLLADDNDEERVKLRSEIDAIYEISDSKRTELKKGIDLMIFMMNSIRNNVFFKDERESISDLVYFYTYIVFLLGIFFLIDIRVNLLAYLLTPAIIALAVSASMNIINHFAKWFKNLNSTTQVTLLIGIFGTIISILNLLK